MKRYNMSLEKQWALAGTLLFLLLFITTLLGSLFPSKPIEFDPAQWESHDKPLTHEQMIRLEQRYLHGYDNSNQ